MGLIGKSPQHTSQVAGAKVPIHVLMVDSSGNEVVLAAPPSAPPSMEFGSVPESPLAVNDDGHLLVASALPPGAAADSTLGAISGDIGDVADDEALGNGSLIAVVKRLRTLLGFIAEDVRPKVKPVVSDVVSDAIGAPIALPNFSAAGGVSNYVTAVHAFRMDSGSLPAFVDFTDGVGGPVIYRMKLPDTLPSSERPYFHTSENTALAVHVSEAGIPVFVNVSGYQAE